MGYASGKRTLNLGFSGPCGTTRYFAFYAGTVEAVTGSCAGKQVFVPTFLSDEAAVTFVQ